MKIKLVKIKFIRLLVLLLDWIIPKQKNLIIYGSNRYFDNTRYFFEYMVKNHSEYDNVWLTHSQKVLAEFYLGDCIEIRSMVGLWKFLRAKFVVMSHGYGDFDIFLQNRCRKKKIMLWHGIPIKKIMLASEYKILKQTYKFDFFAVSSRLEQYLMSYCFGLKKGIAQITGTPRQDIILFNSFSKDKKTKDDFLSEIEYNEEVEKIILYAPTYREKGTHFFPFTMKVERIKTFLEENKAIIIIRKHFNDKLPIFTDEIKSILKRVVFLSQEDYSDVCDFLHLVDVLITDYSSIYFDFLLLDRPIISISYDIDDYEDKWGFLYAYEGIFAGRMVTTFDEFMDILDLSFLHPNTHKKERNKMKYLFYDIADGGACKRIFEWIDENY